MNMALALNFLNYERIVYKIYIYVKLFGINFREILFLQKKFKNKFECTSVRVKFHV